MKKCVRLGGDSVKWNILGELFDKKTAELPSLTLREAKIGQYGVAGGE